MSLRDKLKVIVKFTCTYCGKADEWQFETPAFTREFYVCTIGAACTDCAKRLHDEAKRQPPGEPINGIR